MKSLQLHKPLSNKQLQALEIGSVLRTLCGCISNLQHLNYNKILNRSIGYANMHPQSLNDSVNQLIALETAVRAYNMYVAETNKEARMIAKTIKKLEKETGK